MVPYFFMRIALATTLWSECTRGRVEAGRQIKMFCSNPCVIRWCSVQNG